MELNYEFDTAYDGTIKIGLKFEEYVNGGIAITMMSNTEGLIEPWTVATIWTEGLAPDEVCIKDYSENSGVLLFLIQNKIVAPAHRTVRISSWVVAPVCKLLITPGKV